MTAEEEQFFKNFIVDVCTAFGKDYRDPRQVMSISGPLYEAVMATGRIPQSFTYDNFRASIVRGARKAGKV